MATVGADESGSSTTRRPFSSWKRSTGKAGAGGRLRRLVTGMAANLIAGLPARRPAYRAYRSYCPKQEELPSRAAKSTGVKCSSRRRAPTRPWILLVVSLVAWGSAAGPTDAAGPPAAHQPDPVAQPDDCNLRRSAATSVRDERRSCLRVDAASSVPDIGQPSELQFSVTAAAPRDVTYRIKLSGNLEFVGTPEGTHTGTGPSPWGDGTITPLATGAVRLGAGETAQFVAGIRPTGGGPAQVEVQADASNGPNRDGAADHVFFTVGRGVSMPDPTRGGTRPAPGPVRPGSPGGDQVPAAMDAGADPPPVRSLATSCVSGRWTYLDPNGVLRPSRNYGVQAWDADADSADDLLAAGTTANDDGSYNLCFDGSGEFDGTQEVYVRFVSGNTVWRVRDTAASNRDYENQTDTVSVPDGGSHDFGPLLPANNPPIHRALHAYDSINDLWNWTPGSCFDALDATCRQMVVNWTPDATDGTFYDSATKDIHLVAADPDAPHITIHEAAHAVMDDVYEDNYPATPNCADHAIHVPSSAGCAWSEGFAEWVPVSVLDDPVFRFPDGTAVDLESPSWDSFGWSVGDTVEGRVAGAMIDISDATNEGWDRSSEGDPSNQWDTLLHTHSSSFSEFFLVDRAARGHDTGHSGARASVFQNSIDYAFRDPLPDQVPLLRPGLDQQLSSHTYRYDTSVPAWSGTAIRPLFGADYDLRLFDDADLTQNLAASVAAGDNVDYVLVDSHHQPLGDYYPQTFRSSGSYEYLIESQHGSINLGDGMATVPAGHVIAIWDTLMTGGVPTFFRVTPGHPTNDAQLLLHESDPLHPSTWYQARSSAVAASANTGPGSPEGFSFTSTVGGWNALIMVNRGGSGSYTVYRDTTAPTGGVVINNGAASTTSADVTLNLAVVDVDTGVELMQISVDGVLDTEPYVAFSPTATVTLPAGAGTRTVLARFRNNAGMDSPVASANITVQG